MSAHLASRRSFFKSRDPRRVGLGNLGSGFAQPESHLPKDALALAHPKRHPIVSPQVLGKQFAIPQVRGMAEFPGGAPHIPPERRPLLGVKRGGTARSLPLAQPIQAMLLEPLDPALHRTRILSKRLGHLLAALTASNQQQAVQPVVVTRLVGADNFLLDGDTHYLGIGNFQFSHNGVSLGMEPPTVCAIMRHYLCRYVYMGCNAKKLIDSQAPGDLPSFFVPFIL
jgi:hypothetical protein